MSATVFLDGKVTLFAGDCLAVLETMTADSIDSVCTDPPYHLASIVKRFGADNAAPAKTGVYGRSSRGFMGKVWDGGDIAFRPETWTAIMRVMKPGAYVLAFSSTRTFGRMQVAAEDAGFITHPFIAWIFGSGFPKAHKVEAEGWEGWRYGAQSLKPAIEPIYMGQKPFSEDTGTANVVKHGVGAVNVAACRVGPGERVPGGGKSKRGAQGGGIYGDGEAAENARSHTIGRWPANVIHDGSEEVLAAFPETTSVGHHPAARGKGGIGNDGHKGQADLAERFGDTGSAARFFYQVKSDDRCSLCDVNIAIQDSKTVSTRTGVTAGDGVPVSPPPENAIRLHHTRALASNANDSSSVCHRPHNGSVAKNAETWPLERIVQNVRSAAVLCGSCATDIAQRLVAVRLSGHADKSPISRSIAAFKETILSRCLANYVASRESTDTILTTESLRELFGSVFHAIDDYTNSARSEANTAFAPSRFWYSGKAGSDDRLGARHPTIKPVDLMRYLCRLVTPPNGTILDPFAGTGTTAEAAFYEGFRAILIEREAEYQADIARRMKLVMAGPEERSRETAKAKHADKPEDHGPLFGVSA